MQLDRPHSKDDPPLSEWKICTALPCRAQSRRMYTCNTDGVCNYCRGKEADVFMSECLAHGRQWIHHNPCCDAATLYTADSVHARLTRLEERVNILEAHERL